VLLGFGNSGKDLQSQYSLTLVGESPINDRKAVELELTPKSNDVRQQIAKIDLWLDESNWLPIQQQFFEAGTDDYFIIHYTNIVRNARIDENTFKPKWPKGTQRLKHPS
jgi:outer membrane lipoprotein-sorting protein